MERRAFLRLAGTIGLGMALPGLAACSKSDSVPSVPSGSSQSAAPPAIKTIRHGILQGNLGSLVLTLPKVEEAHRLTYDIKPFRDTTAALQALDQGEIDACNLTTQHLVRAIDEGMKVTMVCGWGGGYNVLFARADLPVQKDDWAGLKALAAERKKAGKPIKIGVPTGSLQHLKLIWALKTAGIDPEKDVDTVNIPFPEHARAIEGGEVDLAMGVAVFAAMSINSGKGKLFNHLVGGRSGKQEIGFAVRRQLIEKEPDVAERVVKSHVEAIKQFMTDVNRQVELELAYTKLPKPVLEMAQGQFLKFNYRLDVADVEGMAKEMFEVGWVKKDYASQVKDFINLSFLAKATGEPIPQLSTWKT